MRTDPTLVEEGLTHYQGEFLAGLHLLDAGTFDTWADRQRDSLHALAIETMEWLARLYLQQGEYESGAAMARRILDLEP